ncbi:MAG: hypoxanthine phosphoribosyltransferase [candidate division WOR-3 bacterium]|nr:hypoxanthine phosphoribosyltransferase [candidate division WOR-3 bacterium]
MSKKISTLIDEDELNKAITALASRLEEEYRGKAPVFIVILKGAFVFASRLLLKMDIQLNVDFMVISSYGSRKVSSGIVRIEEDLTINIEDRHVVIVEDIIDTGTTLSFLKKKVLANNPKSLKIITLLDKPSRRKTELIPDHSCFEIEDRFVVGFGLDHAQYYRNLPFVGILMEE